MTKHSQVVYLILKRHCAALARFLGFKRLCQFVENLHFLANLN